MIEVSNASFNHQSMSFKDERQSPSFEDMLATFNRNADLVIEDCLDNPNRSLKILALDATKISAEKLGTSIDLIITSPPYPNRMSYIRELRPYMYWLGYLEKPADAGELDWLAIGGTWGVATSRLLEWRPADAFIPKSLLLTIAKIQAAHEKNGILMANYVHKYFVDMYQHFKAIFNILNNGGSINYIVGNSTFYGHVVPTEEVFIEQLKSIGFVDVKANVIRKRNSKKELFEYNVTATKR